MHDSHIFIDEHVATLAAVVVVVVVTVVLVVIVVVVVTTGGVVVALVDGAMASSDVVLTSVALGVVLAGMKAGVVETLLAFPVEFASLRFSPSSRDLSCSCPSAAPSPVVLGMGVDEGMVAGDGEGDDIGVGEGEGDDMGVGDGEVPCPGSLSPLVEFSFPGLISNWACVVVVAEAGLVVTGTGTSVVVSVCSGDVVAVVVTGTDVAVVVVIEPSESSVVVPV